MSVGSNESDVQAIAEAEDKGWKARLIWLLLYALKLNRSNANHLISEALSFLIMDSRGCYDKLTGTETPGLLMENTKSLIDILQASQGLTPKMSSHPAWIPGDIYLADSLTKACPDARKTMML